MSLIIGQLLNNRYRIDALLGQGGMGVVVFTSSMAAGHSSRHQTGQHQDPTGWSRLLLVGAGVVVGCKVGLAMVGVSIRVGVMAGIETGGVT
jgi:hypothetical protein